MTKVLPVNCHTLTPSRADNAAKQAGNVSFLSPNRSPETRRRQQALEFGRSIESTDVVDSFHGGHRYAPQPPETRTIQQISGGITDNFASVASPGNGLRACCSPMAQAIGDTHGTWGESGTQPTHPVEC